MASCYQFRTAVVLWLFLPLSSEKARPQAYEYRRPRRDGSSIQIKACPGEARFLVSNIGQNKFDERQRLAESQNDQFYLDEERPVNNDCYDKGLVNGEIPLAINKDGKPIPVQGVCLQQAERADACETVEITANGDERVEEASLCFSTSYLTPGDYHLSIFGPSLKKDPPFNLHLEECSVRGLPPKTITPTKEKAPSQLPKGANDTTGTNALDRSVLSYPACVCQYETPYTFDYHQLAQTLLLVLLLLIEIITRVIPQVRQRVKHRNASRTPSSSADRGGAPSPTSVPLTAKKSDFGSGTPGD